MPADCRQPQVRHSRSWGSMRAWAPRDARIGPIWPTSNATAPWRRRRRPDGMPREIADAVAGALRGSRLVASAEVAGPGFINLRLSAACLAECADEIARDARAGAGAVEKPRRVVIDYGGPNVAKEMHVGHLRSLDHRRQPAAPLPLQGRRGDGRRALRRLGPPDGPADQRGAVGAAGAAAISKPVSLGLTRAGRVPRDDGRSRTALSAASAKSKADEARREADRKATAELQAGRPGYRLLWQHFRDVTRAAWSATSSARRRLRPLEGRERRQRPDRAR